MSKHKASHIVLHSLILIATLKFSYDNSEYCPGKWSVLDFVPNPSVQIQDFTVISHLYILQRYNWDYQIFSDHNKMWRFFFPPGFWVIWKPIAPSCLLNKVVLTNLNRQALLVNLVRVTAIYKKWNLSLTNLSGPSIHILETAYFGLLYCSSNDFKVLRFYFSITHWKIWFLCEVFTLPPLHRN